MKKTHDRSFYPVIEQQGAHYQYANSCKCPISILIPAGSPIENLFKLKYTGSDGTLATTGEGITPTGSTDLIATVTGAPYGGFGRAFFTNQTGGVIFGGIFDGAALAINLPPETTLHVTGWIFAERNLEVTVTMVNTNGSGANGFSSGSAKIIGNGGGQQFYFTVTNIAPITSFAPALEVEASGYNQSGSVQFQVSSVMINRSTRIDTWHYGTSDATDRRVGALANLCDDLGLEIISLSGFGQPPVENVSTSFARLDGSHMQRTRFLPRTLTITADISDCEFASNVIEARAALNAAINYRFRPYCREPLYLVFEEFDCDCRSLMERVQIPVYYSGGLEGDWSSRFHERINLQFESHEQVSWESIVETGRRLSGDNPSAVTVRGTDFAYPRFVIEPDASNPPVSATFTRFVNYLTETAIAVKPTLIIDSTAAARSSVELNLDPLNYSFTKTDTAGVTTSVLNQIDYANSTVGQFLLIPGSQTVEFDGVSPAGDLDATMYWRPRFLSVDDVTRRKRSVC